MRSLVPGHACHHCKGHWSPHLTIPHTTPLSLALTLRHTHTWREQNTLEKRLVWRSLAHLSLYQTLSPSLQRRCLFEECATVGRMNLHDELGIYLFIFHQAAPSSSFLKLISIIRRAATDSLSVKGNVLDNDCAP